MCDLILQDYSNKLLLKHLDKIDLKSLLFSRNDLDTDIIEKIFQSGVSKEYIWRTQKVDEALIEKYANNVADWSFIGLYQKLSVEFIMKYKDKIDFTYFNFDQYSVDELLSIDNVIFPYRAFLNRSLEEKIKLCTHKKLGICGKVIKSKDISYDFFDATLLAPKSVTFMQFKPYLLCNQILVYLHPFVLEYSHVLELLAEDCFLVTKRYLEILLSYKKLNITISEWDTLMMLLHLET